MVGGLVYGEGQVMLSSWHINVLRLLPVWVGGLGGEGWQCLGEVWGLTLLSTGGGCDKGSWGMEGGTPQFDSSSAAGKGGFQT